MNIYPIVNLGAPGNARKMLGQATAPISASDFDRLPLPERSVLLDGMSESQKCALFQGLEGLHRSRGDLSLAGLNHVAVEAYCERARSLRDDARTCPFCASTQVLVIERGSVSCCCLNCACLGPLCPRSEGVAVDWWNTRPAMAEAAPEPAMGAAEFDALRPASRSPFLNGMSDSQRCALFRDLEALHRSQGRTVEADYDHSSVEIYCDRTKSVADVKPCPCCACTQCEVGPYGSYAVRCLNCSTTGPHDPGEVGAIERWNDRFTRLSTFTRTPPPCPPIARRPSEFTTPIGFAAEPPQSYFYQYGGR